MAIAIRGGSPATASFSGTTDPSLTLTGTQQPQSGDLLVIIHGNDFYALSNMQTPTVGGSTTGVTSVGVDADGGTNAGHIRAYTYLVASTGDLTVATAENGTHDEEKILAVYVLSGADTSSPVDGTPVASNGSGSTSAVVSGVTTTATDSYLITHITPNSTANTGAITPPGTMTETYDVNVASVMDAEGAVQQLVSSGATGTRTFTLTNSQPWIALAFAVKTASAGSSPAVQPVSPLYFQPPGMIAPNGVWAPGPYDFSPASATISVSDAGAATDLTAATAAVPVADSAAGADALAAAAALAAADSGSAADAVAVSVPVAVADAGSAADSVLVGFGIFVADSGSGSDTPAVTATVPLADSGSGADAAAVAATVPLADTGSGADALTVTATVPVADSGSGTDPAVVGFGIAVADNGSGSDAAVVSAAVPVAESGAGSDARTTTAAVPVGDAGSAAESNTGTATVPLADSGSGADAVAAGVPIAVADAGAGSDAGSATAITVPLSDAGAASEVARATTATVSLADVAAAAETTALAVLLSLADSGSGADAVAVVRTILVADSGTGADAASGQQQTSSQINVGDTGSGAERFRVRLHRPTSGTTTRPGSGTTTVRPFSGITTYG